MKSKTKDYSKKGTGHHKMRGPVKNRKKASPKSIQQNTMMPSAPNQADRDLGSLLGK